MSIIPSTAFRDSVAREAQSAIAEMRKAKLLTKKAILQHIAMNRRAYATASYSDAARIEVWNTYLEMELERVTKIPCDVRWNRK
jgi:hypothetical protein